MKEIINIINNLENESEEDKEQIKRALKCTKYELCGDYTTTPIARKEAILTLIIVILYNYQKGVINCAKIIRTSKKK